MPKIVLPDPPGPDASPEEVAHFRFGYAVKKFMLANDLSLQDLATMTGLTRGRISSWFRTGQHQRFPTYTAFMELICKQFPDMTASGLHGRHINEVFALRGKEYTHFEELLLNENTELRQIIEEKDRIIASYEKMNPTD